MTNKQEAKLNMYSAIISFCNKHYDVIASIPALEATFIAFQNVVSGIENFSRNEKFAIPGITQNKKTLRENLARIAAAIASNIFAYAVEKGITELKPLSNFSLPELLKLKDKDLPGVCRGIAATATANLAGLAAYNITAATVKELTDALDAYQTSAPLPRTAATDLSTSLKMLEASFDEADNILKLRMDKIINPLKISHAQFHQTYFANRTLIDTYTTATQIKGSITTDDNGKPVRGAIISVTENDAVAKSDAEGKYVLKQASPGPYTIKATKDGYTPETIKDVDVKLGQITRIDIVLKKSKE